ncbi:MAG: hypothetical protein Q4P13_04685 [Psychrobacter sp.]|nr:hypothetical protein [Psychrobacter sp.]
MKRHFNYLSLRPTSLESQPFNQLLLVAIIGALSLSACSKSDEQNASNTAATQTTNSAADTQAAEPVAVTTEPAPEVEVVEVDNPKPEVEVIEVADKSAGAAQPSISPPQPDPEVAIVGTQISNLDYKGPGGERLKVTYETSVSGELKATATLPSGKKVTLNAPAGQGNNPTYRSADGSVEIVSHGGGGSINLVQGGKPMGFDAVSAEAEVIPQ